MTADLLQFTPLQAGDLELFEENFTGAWVQNSQDQPQDGALAAATLAHHDQAFLWLNRKREVVEYLFVFEFHDDIAQLHHVGVLGTHVGKKLT